MISERPADADGVLYDSWEPVGYFIVKEDNVPQLALYCQAKGIEFMIQEIKTFKPDYSHDETWADLKRKASKAYQELKAREMELEHER